MTVLFWCKFFFFFALFLVLFIFLSNFFSLLLAFTVSFSRFFTAVFVIYDTRVSTTIIEVVDLRKICTKRGISIVLVPLGLLTMVSCPAELVGL